MIGAVLKKHPEFDGIADPVAPGVVRWVQSLSW